MEGVVVMIAPDEILLDIGYKSEGVIPPRRWRSATTSTPRGRQGRDSFEASSGRRRHEGRLILSKSAPSTSAPGAGRETWRRSRSGPFIEVVKGGLSSTRTPGLLPDSLASRRSRRQQYSYERE